MTHLPQISYFGFQVYTDLMRLVLVSMTTFRRVLFKRQMDLSLTHISFVLDAFILSVRNALTEEKQMTPELDWRHIHKERIFSYQKRLALLAMTLAKMFFPVLADLNKLN